MILMIRYENLKTIFYLKGLTQNDGKQKLIIIYQDLRELSLK